MQTEPTRKIPDDEIDLRSIATKIYSIIAYPFHLFLSHKLITLYFMIAAVLLAVVVNRTALKTYTSSFIIQPLDKHEKVHLKILYDVQTLLKYKDFRSIAKELKIDTLTSKKIIALRTLNPSLKNGTDSINNTEVIITTSDFNQFLPIQNALITYLETNPYFAKIKELRIKQIEVELTQVEKEIVQLDSLKMLQMRNYGKQNVSGQNPVLLNELINPTAVYSAQTDRIYKKADLMARNTFLDNFQLIKSCVVIRQATSPPRILIISAILVPVFLLICAVFLHFRLRRKKNPDLLNESRTV